jgi:hypothetical protein
MVSGSSVIFEQEWNSPETVASIVNFAEKSMMVLKDIIYDANLQHPDVFQKAALEMFHHQYDRNLIYRRYCDHINVDRNTVHCLEDIPFLPVSLYKSQEVKTGNFLEEAVFYSSSTSGQGQSKVLVQSLSAYEDIAAHCFRFFLGDSAQYCHLALLPSYLEREGSSLVYMMESFIRSSHYAESGFYLYNHRELYETMIRMRDQGTPVILWGVTFALLDFAGRYSIDFEGLRIIETGGMKGRGRELVRMELYEILRTSFKGVALHSEYGMTEMMSQVYSRKDGLFSPPPHVKVMVRDVMDPLQTFLEGKHKGINMIDLSNVDTCCFLALGDMGNVYADGQFEILGRIDFEDLRGCNLMMG